MMWPSSTKKYRRERARKWRAAHPERTREIGRRSNFFQNLRFRIWLDEQKAHPCSDCGHSFPPECMDFDHVRGKKLCLINVCGSTRDRSRLIREMKKCELVCANCHRTRTRQRKLNGRKRRALLRIYLPKM
jgi:hypothetical protein